jgi:hypothetical protein
VLFDVASFQSLRPYLNKARQDAPDGRPAGREITDRRAGDASMERTREITEAKQRQRERIGRIEIMDRSFTQHEEVRSEDRSGRSRRL